MKPNPNYFGNPPSARRSAWGGLTIAVLGAILTVRGLRAWSDPLATGPRWLDAIGVALALGLVAVGVTYLWLGLRGLRADPPRRAPDGEPGDRAS